MKYFYTIKGLATPSGNNVYPTTSGNPVFIPCRIGSYTLDGISNFKPSDMSFNLVANVGTVNTTRGYYTYGGQNYPIILSETPLVPSKLIGPSRMCISDTEIIGGGTGALGYYLNELPSTSISGRYRLHTIISTPIQADLAASVCPVSYTINNINYRYLVFPGGGGYTDLITPNSASRYGLAGFYTVPAFRTVPTDYDLFTETASSATVKTEYAGQIIDFGDTPQIIPQAVYDFIIANADVIYPYTYTVKNKRGAVLDQITECPSMQSISVSRTGNTVFISLVGVDSQTYELSFTISIPEGYAFLGMSTSPGAKRAEYATGQTTAISWEGDMTLYPVISKYRPPVTTFVINAYHNSSDEKTVSKTITATGTITGVLRTGSSLMNPIITIESETVPTWNYCKIPAFDTRSPSDPSYGDRYYFVRGIESVSYGLWQITLALDVLMTYAEAIKDLTAIIGRQEHSYNPMIIDSNIPLDNDTEQIYVSIANPSVINSNQDNDSTTYNILMTVIGGNY